MRATMAATIGTARTPCTICECRRPAISVMVREKIGPWPGAATPAPSLHRDLPKAGDHPGATAGFRRDGGAAGGGEGGSAGALHPLRQALRHAQQHRAVKAKLTASGHWIFADPARLAVLEMCGDCRAVVATERGVDPHAGPARPVTSTTRD